MTPHNVAKMLRPMRRRLSAIIARGYITAVNVTGARVVIQAGLRDGEVAEGVELVEPFGYTAPPLADSDGVIVLQLAGGLRLAINAGGRYHRPNDIEPGESCLYNQHGDRITLRNDHTINVEAAESCNVTTRTATVTASERVKLDTPDVDATGNITAAGEIRDRATTMSAIRAALNSHEHQGDGSGAGNTGVPTTQVNN